jgi:hypothetical protein
VGVTGAGRLEQALRLDSGTKVKGDNDGREEGTESDHFCRLRVKSGGELERGVESGSERGRSDGIPCLSLVASYRPHRVVCCHRRKAVVDVQAVRRNAPMSRLTSMIRGDRAIP